MAKMGKYELVRQLATGGMAEVFLARTEGALGFEKTVVVKRIRPHLLDDPQFLQMFLGEAKISAQLNHPNIAQVFDFGEAEGSYFLAMEHIDGPDLRTLSTAAHKSGKPIPFPLCAKIVSYACEGLAFAHEYANPETGQPLNIVHRDISPDNIVIARNGAVKVVDFGIAKAAEQLHQTQPGLRKGKMAYMSPEYIKGDQPDRRSDVFALGIVLYELISNRKPYDAQSEIALMHAMIYEPMIPVRERRPDVPEELARIVDRALVKERDRRYPSCRELQEDLERFAVSEGEPVGAVHISRLVASLQEELDATARARTPSRPKSGPGAGKTPPGQSSPSGQKTPPGQKSPSGQKTPPRQKTPPGKTTSPSGEKQKPVTPPRPVQISAEDSGDRTVRMDGPALVARAAAIRVEPSSESTVRMTAADLAASAPTPAFPMPAFRPDSKTLPETPAQQGERAGASASTPILPMPAFQPSGPKAPVVVRVEPADQAEPVQAKKGSSAPRPRPKPRQPDQAAADPTHVRLMRWLMEEKRKPLRQAGMAIAALLLVALGYLLARCPTTSEELPHPPTDARSSTRPDPTAPPVPVHPPTEEATNTPAPATDDAPPAVPNPPPPPPPPEPKPVMGVLEVTSNFQGVVKIGKRKVKLPLRGMELRPGEHDVELIDPATDFWVKRAKVKIETNKIEKLKLDVGDGTVFVIALGHAGAEVYVDQDTQPRDKVPCKISLREGKHTIKVVSPKSPKPHEESIIVEPGKELRVTAKFQ